jgi:hypothetical protein
LYCDIDNHIRLLSTDKACKRPDRLQRFQRAKSTARNRHIDNTETLGSQLDSGVIRVARDNHLIATQKCGPTQTNPMGNERPILSADE